MSHPSMVQTMHQVGIPVWYVRHQGTLHEHTRIGAIRPCISSSIAFDTTQFVVEGWNSMPTPTWLEGQLFDLSSESILRQYRILSHVNKPTLRPTFTAINAASNLNDGIDSLANNDNAYPNDVRDDNAPRLENATAQSSRKRPSDSNTVEQEVTDLRTGDPSHAVLYHLPPVHLFCKSGTPFHATIMHNWLHIRQWCFSRAFNPPVHSKVQMTAAQWRLALEG
ncbi:hypothetical protein WOLCODRAFT_156156 [Wolfiporia cocos MD-104 SS10]|uniref:Uncharacterized protein n=1 Tax=Wolfiporia cocos (strain MD-104) TaxID=742152 RepID=A0A2H3J1A0_WOLCO|nr:hypothetical protein WOLCODRAFT_156156 [Wolfiporia cocos MD-104 SS10]